MPVMLVLEDELGELGGGDPDEIHEEQDQQADNKPPESAARTVYWDNQKEVAMIGFLF